MRYAEVEQCGFGYATTATKFILLNIQMVKFEILSSAFTLFQMGEKGGKLRIVCGLEMTAERE